MSPPTIDDYMQLPDGTWKLIRKEGSVQGEEFASSGEATNLAPNQATALVNLVSQEHLLHDIAGDPFAILIVHGHREVWSIRSRQFRNWLRREYYLAEGKAPGGEAVSSALGILEARALFDGPEVQLNNRVAWIADSVYYDLADRDWRAVRIDQAGWSVVDDPPILFRRYAHQQPQVEPTRAGDLTRLLEFLNVRERDKELLQTWLVAAFLPDIPHPVPDFHGEKGSGKSVGQQALRRLIDPSAAERLAMPRDDREMIQQLSHHYAPVYDNVDNLSKGQSDILCRAVTGEGSSKRELYSNDDDIIYSYKRVIMLNGVNVVARRPDLLDRTIQVGLERIGKGNRREEREFWEAFEEARPSILGGVFDALSSAMRIYPTLNLSALERMADFTRWGAAIAEAIGWSADAFLESYALNLAVQTREAVEQDLVGSAVLLLMRDREDWSGTPTELLGAMTEAASDEGLLRLDGAGTVRDKNWPGGPHILTRRLNELKSNLRDLGVEIAEGPDRLKTLRRTDREGAESSVSSVGSAGRAGSDRVQAEATDAANATSRISQWEVEIK